MNAITEQLDFDPAALREKYRAERHLPDVGSGPVDWNAL